MSLGAGSQCLLQLLFMGGRVAGCAGKSWLRVSGWEFRDGGRGGMGYGGRTADGDVPGDGFRGQRTVPAPVSWLLSCDRLAAQACRDAIAAPKGVM